MKKQSDRENKTVRRVTRDIKTVPGRDERARHIVTRYSRGNLLLQLGRYVTDRQVREELEDLKDYEF